MTKILGESRKDFPKMLRSSEWKMDEEHKYLITGWRTVDFKDNKPPKPVLTLKTIEGTEVDFAVNWTNGSYLVDQGYEESEELAGKTIVIKKEARILENKDGKKFDSVGLFVTQVINEKLVGVKK